MSQDNHIGFFRQYFIACFQPGKYKQLLEKKTGSHILYMMTLFLFLLLVDTLIPFGAWMTTMGGFRGLFQERLPAFTVENGAFEIEKPISFEIGGIIRVEMDSDVEQYTEKDFDGNYQEEILIGRTNILIRAMDRASEIPLSSLGNMYLDNQGLTAAIPGITVMVVFYMLLTLVSKSVQYLGASLIYGLICRVGVRSPEGKTLTIKEAFLIAAYAKTLFAIIASVNVSLGYMINSFWVSVISIVIIMSYIFKAEVSVLKPEIS